MTAGWLGSRLPDLDQGGRTASVQIIRRTWAGSSENLGIVVAGLFEPGGTGLARTGLGGRDSVPAIVIYYHLVTA